MDDQELKAWRCGGGHVLGVVMRSANGVRRMLLYRQAVNLRSADLLSTDLGHGLHRLGNAALGTTAAFEENGTRVNADEHGDGVEEVDVMAVVEGYVMDVRCSICGRLRTWVPGEEALRRLLEGRGEGFGTRKARKEVGTRKARKEAVGTRKARKEAKDAKGEGMVGASGAGFGTRKARKEFGTRKARKDAKGAKGEGMVGASGAGDGRVEG